MSPPSSDAKLWTFSRPVAQLRCESLVAKVDVSKPQMGLREVALQSRAISGNVLSLTSNREDTWPAVVTDSYVRGGDLVATYSPSSDWPYAQSIYWRVESRDAALAAI